MENKITVLILIFFNLLGVLFISWEYEWSNPINMLLICNIVIILIIKTRYTNLLIELLSDSSDTVKITPNKSTIKKHISNTNEFKNQISFAITSINEIGKPEFINRIKTIKDDNIRTSLLTANEKLIELRRKEEENAWITKGVAEIADLKHKGNDLAEYTFQAISMIVKYLGANQGSFFLLKKQQKETYFELTSTYAYGKKRFLEKRINLGEGLVGQAYYEKSITYMTDVPKDYVKITSGLGEALPRCICIIPLISENEIHGVIEIASFNLLKSAELEYLKNISETIGYNLNSIAANGETEALLKESQKMAQELKSQEEELRQNMEELNSTQEQMSRKQSEINAVLSSLSTVELDLDGRILDANDVFLGITGYEYTDLIGNLYSSLIPQHASDSLQYNMMWSSILSGSTFSGEFKILSKTKAEIWMSGNFTPILNASGKPYKVMVISLFTTQDKEKLLELQEMVAAFKGCFAMAEISPELTFRAANDLFLQELGIKRLELKKSLPIDVLQNGSYKKVEEYIRNNLDTPSPMELEIQNKDGLVKKFDSMLIKIGDNQSLKKKGLLILKKTIEYGV